MAEKVLKFPERRKAGNDLNMDRWWCNSCNHDEFKLGADGRVYCSRCTGCIRRLRIYDLQGDL